jgi:hypothetical protein
MPGIFFWNILRSVLFRSASERFVEAFWKIKPGKKQAFETLVNALNRYCGVGRSSIPWSSAVATAFTEALSRAISRPLTNSARNETQKSP